MNLDPLGRAHVIGSSAFIAAPLAGMTLAQCGADAIRIDAQGLENVLGIAGINGGRHVVPTVGGDTLYASSGVLERGELPGRDDVGALRISLFGPRNCAPQMVAFEKTAESKVSAAHPAVVLDLDYTVLMPRRPATLRADHNHHEVEPR
jgi:acyl dehydratase